jgi:hypothetical protein
MYTNYLLLVSALISGQHSKHMNKNTKIQKNMRTGFFKFLYVSACNQYKVYVQMVDKQKNQKN